MGTRGAFGTRIDGIDRIHYNQFDSYPEGYGITFTRDAIAMLQAEDMYREKARNIRLVDEDGEPSAFERQKYKKFWEQVSTGKDWYSLLRGLQGELKQMLDAGIGPQAHPKWMHDSLFNEYNYIVNFDDRVVEYYKGFNQDWDAAGRYAGKAAKTEKNPRTGKRDKVKYAGVRLVSRVPFDTVKGLAPLSDEQLTGWLNFLYDDGESKVDYTEQLASLSEASGVPAVMISARGI